MSSLEHISIKLTCLNKRLFNVIISPILDFMICLINDGIDNNDYINNTVYNPNALHFVNYGNVTNNAMNNDNYNAYRGRKLISWSSYLETHSTQLETSMNLASFTFLIIGERERVTIIHCKYIEKEGRGGKRRKEGRLERRKAS